MRQKVVKDVSNFEDYRPNPDRRDNLVRVVNSQKELHYFNNLTEAQIANS